MAKDIEDRYHSVANELRKLVKALRGTAPTKSGVDQFGQVSTDEIKGVLSVHHLLIDVMQQSGREVQAL